MFDRTLGSTIVYDAPPVAPTESKRSGVAVATNSPCHSCNFRKTNFCGAVLNKVGDPSIGTRHLSKRARLNICRAGDPYKGLIAICDGWALRFAQLPNGKRQILSVVLPGDIVSVASVFDQSHQYSLQAVTDVRYAYLSAEEVQKKLDDGGPVTQSWARFAAAEQRLSDELLVDLGQRTAHERIAAFVLRMMERLSPGQDVPSLTFDFPLRQQQIAELLGLTPVHVCRVLSAFRKDGICDISNGMAQILDLDQLRQIGEAV